MLRDEGGNQSLPLVPSAAGPIPGPLGCRRKQLPLLTSHRWLQESQCMLHAANSAAQPDSKHSESPPGCLPVPALHSLTLTEEGSPFSRCAHGRTSASFCECAESRLELHVHPAFPQRHTVSIKSIGWTVMIGAQQRSETYENINFLYTFNICPPKVNVKYLC